MKLLGQNWLDVPVRPSPVCLSYAGFALAGPSTGAPIGRCGVRTALAAGGGSYVLAGLYLATRPPFSAFVPAAPAPGAPGPVPGRMLSAALRDRGVQLGAAMLALYVGLELSVGNCGFSYLVQIPALAGRHHRPERRDVGTPAVRDSAGPGAVRRLAANRRPALTK
jgi:hypothetical protein